MAAGGLRAVLVHVLPAGGPVLPCVLAGMLLGGADVPVFPWVCPECLGFETGERGPVGRWGSGKVSPAVAVLEVPDGSGGEGPL